MKSFILNSALYIFLILSQVFFTALIAPFNTINIISAYLVLLFWTDDFEKVFLAALVLGVMSDFVNRAPFLGIGGVEFSFALLSIVVLRYTIITSENRISLFFLSMVFNAVYYAIEIARNFHFSAAILEEALFEIIINSILTFAAYVFIDFFTSQVRKDFI